MGEISVLLPVAFPDEDYCSSLHQSTGGDTAISLDTHEVSPGFIWTYGILNPIS